MTAVTAGIFRNTCCYRMHKLLRVSALDKETLNAGVIAEMPDLKTLCVEKQMHSLTH